MARYCQVVNKVLFREPVIKLKYCWVRDHVHQHKKQLTDIPIQGLTYSLPYFSSDIITGVQIP